jgi:uncharacterized membrane protein YkoI
MMRLSLALALATFATGAAVSAAPSNPPKAKLTLVQARTIALRAAPGRIISAEYEKEGGGWRYSFDIQQRGHVQEIGVDGMTGRIVENKSEGKVDHD